MLKTTYVDNENQPLFYAETIDEAIRVNLHPYDMKTVLPESQIHLPLAPGAPSLRYDELIYSTGHVKSGCHDPRGMLLVYGAGVPKGLKLGASTILDFAPTILTMMGLDVPSEMKGRVMEELTDPVLRTAAVAS